MPFGTFNQFPAVALFEAAHLLTDGGLGDEVLRRRQRKAARFGQVAEDLQGFECMITNNVIKIFLLYL